MNRIKFKNVNKVRVFKIVLAILITIFQVFFFSVYLANTVSNKITEYASAKVKKENILLLKNAFEQEQYSSYTKNDLISVVKNSKDEIIEVEFNMDECFKLLSHINEYINDQITPYNYNGYRLDIPVGVMCNHPLFVNIGPKIPVKVELANTSLGNVHTEVKSFGINNALVEVYIDITLRFTVIYPTSILETEDKYFTLLSSKIISGTVPNFLGGSINSKSGTIELPINQ